MKTRTFRHQVLLGNGHMWHQRHSVCTDTILTDGHTTQSQLCRSCKLKWTHISTKVNDKWQLSAIATFTLHRVTHIIKAK